MKGGAIIGIDLGTSAVKAAVIGADGVLRDSFAEAYPTRRSGQNIVEQDAGDWMRLIDRALSSFAGHEVAAIGLCSQVNTHLFTDAAGQPLLPAILWQDGRASAEAARLDAGVSAAEKSQWWGAPMPIDASHPISRMAWVARHHPEIWARTAHVLLPKDYCIWQLTGQLSSDPLSNIGLVGADLDYIDGVLALVSGAASRVAPLVGVTAVAGEMQSGPFRGVPVISGTMDAWAGMVGTGAALEGATVYISGTSENLGISSRRIVPTPGVILFPEYDGLRVHAAPTQSGGEAKRWFAEAFGLTPDAMSDLVAATPRGPATPLFLPQLAGERAPIWDADLRAAFLGVSHQTGQGDFARAVYEGVALSARHALDALRLSADVPVSRINCGGGGFRSPVWNQIRADVLGIPLATLSVKDAGVLGAAIIAGIGAGRFAGFAEAQDALCRIEREYWPDPAKRDHYDALYDLYRQAIATNADLGKRLAALNDHSGEQP